MYVAVKKWLPMGTAASRQVDGACLDSEHRDLTGVFDLAADDRVVDFGIHQLTVINGQNVVRKHHQIGQFTWRQRALLIFLEGLSLIHI